VGKQAGLEDSRLVIEVDTTLVGISLESIEDITMVDIDLELRIIAMGMVRVAFTDSLVVENNLGDLSSLLGISILEGVARILEVVVSSLEVVVSRLEVVVRIATVELVEQAVQLDLVDKWVLR
jgi:hypothetical protein